MVLTSNQEFVKPGRVLKVSAWPFASPRLEPHTRGVLGACVVPDSEVTAVIDDITTVTGGPQDLQRFHSWNLYRFRKTWIIKCTVGQQRTSEHDQRYASVGFKGHSLMQGGPVSED